MAAAWLLGRSSPGYCESTDLSNAMACLNNSWTQKDGYLSCTWLFTNYQVLTFFNIGKKTLLKQSYIIIEIINMVQNRRFAQILRHTVSNIKTHCSLVQGCVGLRAYSSCTGGKHVLPGEVTCSSKVYTPKQTTDNHTHKHPLLQKINLKTPVNLACVHWECGRNPEKATQTTCKLFKKSAQPRC